MPKLRSGRDDLLTNDPMVRSDPHIRTHPAGLQDERPHMDEVSVDKETSLRR